MKKNKLNLSCYQCLIKYLVTNIFILIFSTAIFAEPISPLSNNEKFNPEEVRLGKFLFNSSLLSADNSISCATCHDIANGGDDGLTTSIGINAQVGPINAPTVLNSRFNFAQFWDGRSATLEEQTEGPIHNTLEMGSNWQQVISKLNNDSNTVKMFKAIYNEEINKNNITKAIVSYEKQLVTLNAPFDQFLSGSKDAISESAKEGYHLFKQMGCISCHQGKNIGGNMYQYFGIMGNYFEDRGNIKTADLGVYNRTLQEKDKYKFKVPSLRNIEKTSPYFHDGSAESLEEAIHIMARYQLGRPISKDQTAKIKSFLLSLTGEVTEDLQ